MTGSRYMKCTACGCPGAYELLRYVYCWNRSCRNFSQDIVSGSVFNGDDGTVNGDPKLELQLFLESVEESEQAPDAFSVWRQDRK